MGGVSKEELLHLKPPEVDADLFCILVEYWFSKPGMVLIFSVLYVFFFLYDQCIRVLYIVDLKNILPCCCNW